MKFNCGFKGLWLHLLIGGLAVVLLPLLLRRSEDPESVPPRAPRVESPGTPLPAEPTSPARPPQSLPADPLLRRWPVAIRQRDEKGVLSAQAEFLAREGEYRGPLMALAKDDPEPRTRAFSIAVLGRMRTPPPEEFFLERMDDAHEYPRTSAVQALEKVGSARCLEAVERRAGSDPSGEVRAAALQAAKALRSR